MRQTQEERNYHVLYQFLHADDLDFTAAQRDPMAYKYLSESGCLTINGKDDAQDWQEVCECFASINLEANQRQEMVQLLASVLSLGNIEFEPDVEGGGVDETNPALVAAAAYMQVAPAELLKALTIKVLQVPGSGPIERQQSGQACTEMRGKSILHQV